VSAALVGTLVVGLLSVIGPSVAPEPAFASTPSAQCTTATGSPQGGLEVYPSHGKVFYIDSGQNQNVDAAYVGYQVKNVSGSTKANLWAKVDSFTGGVVGLANAQDAVYRVGDVANAATQPAFFLLQAGTSTTRAQGHVVRVYNGDPRLSGATELYSCTYNFVAVKETIKAAANKVTAVSSTSAQRLGGNLVVTVKGQTGTIGSGTSSPDGEVLWFTPAARSSWPSASLVLKQTSISFATNKLPDEGGAQNVSTHVNTLVFNNPRTTLAGTNARYYYVATYTFSIAGPVPASIGAVPIAQISSGTQIKHTDVSGITALPGSTLSVSTPVTVGVEKTVSSTIDTSGSDRLLSYTVTLTNSASAAVTLDQVVDDPSAGLTFKANSAQYNSAAISDPAADSSGNLVFQGPFTVAANASRTLTYQMVSSCTTGSFSYANSAYATIGSVVVGQNASTLSGVNISGSCPPTTGTVAVADQTIPPAAITQPASSVATTSATINGSVDPNGVSGQTITFQWGTSSALTGATTVTLTNSTTATDFYAATTNLTGLTSGTRHYYKVTIGSVSGEILSFTTTEVVGTPAVTTDSVTAIVQGTGSDGTAVFNGTIDPNQVSTTPSFVWGLSGNAGADANCTAASYTLSGTVMEDTDDNGSLDANVVLTGAFPSQFSLDATGLSQGKYYCVKARGTYSTTTIEGSPVLFRTQVLSTQTITFPTPSMSTPGSTATLGATTTSPLTIEYTSNTPDVCTVSGNVVTYLSGGICSLTANQPGDTSFYAADPVTVSFTVPTYTLTYNVNGGNGSAPVDGLSPYVKGASVTVSATTPTHASLFFAGWNTQAGGGGTSYASSAVFTIDANTVLYAQWSASTTYTLTYDNNGGTGGPGAAVHGPGTITLSSTAPTRDGYRFSGWNTQAGGGGTSYPSSAANFPMPENATTLYAQWVQVFTVTYDGNGAASGSVPAATTHDSGATPTLSGNSGTLARTGYTFDGWTTTANTGSAVTTVTVSASRTVYARWVANVTYNANSATGGSVPSDSSNYLPGASATVAGNTGTLVRTNYRFDGWNTAANGTGTAYAPSAALTIAGSTELFAQWVQVFTLTYDGNGATSGSVPAATTHDSGATPTLSGNSGTLARTGYTFDGWTTSANTGSAVTTVTVSGNQTVYARWVATVTYNANSGTGSVPTDGTNYVPVATITISGNSGPLARTGFVFGGWNTLANGSGISYEPGATLTNTGDLVLYALWLDEVTLTFDGNGNTGGSVPSAQTHGRGQTVTVPSNSGSLARTGYTFAGWSLSPTGGTTLTPGSGTVTLTANTTALYAKWDLVVSGGGGGGGGAQPTPVAQPPVITPSSPRIPPSRITPVAPTNSLDPSAIARPVLVPRVMLSTPSLPGLSRFYGLPVNGGGSGAQSPGSAFSGQSTIDRGVSTQSNSDENSNTAGRRTVNELEQEKFGGFLPGATASIEILGARTAARFVVSDVTGLDSFTLSRAIQESMPTQATNFFAIDSVQPVNQPTVPMPWTPYERTGVAEFFAGVGLAAPRSLADLNFDDYSQWLSLTANASTYAPGTQVYLTLTSKPLVLASAVVGRDGTVSISGTLPVEFLTAGEHRVRLVGIRALDGVSVDDEGGVQISPEVLEEIERFDLGTQATIAVLGPNAQGGTHAALRVIPLVPIAPWWTLWFILVGALVALAFRLAPVRTTRIRRVSTVVIGVVALLPAVILGWLSTVTVVVWWGLGLGLASVVLSALGPYRKARGDEPAGSRRP
jgi:uncharacterized repeat protein (TIGR02543 family)